MLKQRKSFRKAMSVFLSFSTLAWSLGASLGALLLLANPMPVLAAAPTVMFVEIAPNSSNKQLRVGFSAEVDQTTAETEVNYTLHIGANSYNPNTAVKQESPNSNVLLDFTAALGEVDITPGTSGDTLDISGVKDATNTDTMTAVLARGIFAEMDMGGGFFGPAVIINEAVSNPQRDWNDSTPGGATKFDATYGSGTIDANDEYIELRINQDGMNLSKTGDPKFYLKIFNTNFTTEIGGSASNLEQYHAETNAAGIFDTVRYVSSSGGTISSTKAGDFLVLGGLRGADLSDNVHIALYSGNNFMNSVSFGTFNDMMTDDNAVACGAATGTESSGRDNYGTDMGWNKGDFYQQAGSPGSENTYNPPLKLFGVFPQDATHIGMDFNEPPKQSTIIASNFTVTKVSDSSTIAVSSAFVESTGGGRFVKLTLASAPAANMEYRVTVGAGVTDQGDQPIAEADRIRSFMGFSADSTPPVITGINQPDSKRLEIYFQEQSGIDIGSATVTVAETATPGNTINISSKWSSFDMVTLELASAPTAAMAYTVTFTGLKDWAMPTQNTLTTNNTVSFTGKNFATLLNDGMAPYVMRTVPMDFEASVPTNIKKITVGFSEKMDPATVIATNVKLYNYTMATGALGAQVTSGVTVSYNSDLQTAIIALTEALSASSSYQIFIDGETVSTANAVKDLSGSAMGYNYTSTFTTGTGADTTAANIINTGVDSYWDAGTSKYKDVPVGIGRISVAFDGAMDSSTIVDSDASNAGSPIRISTTSGGTTTYAYGSIEYDNYAKVADFKLSSVLSPNVEYTLAVETTVTDFAGNAIPAKFTRLFTTAGTDSTAPTILSAESGGAGIFIKFSEPVKAAQASNLSNWALYSDANANPTTAVGLGSAMSEYMSFDNAVEIRGLALTAGNYFKIVAAGTIEDLAGNDVVLNSYKTAQVVQASEWKQQLMIWDNYPRMQQNSVPTNTALSARFSDSLNSTTVTTTTVKLYTVNSSGVASEVTGDGLAVSYKSDINTVKFTPPTAGLTANTLYRWKIGTDNPSTSIKDTAGNSLPFPFIVEFFTGSGTDSAAPTVSSTSPANAATGAAAALAKYEINFSEAMDPSTLNSGTILMAKTSEIETGPWVSGTIDYDTYAYKLFFKPAAALAVDTEYTVRVTTSVKDAAGVAVAANIDKTFTTTDTADTTGPKIEFANADPFGLFVKFDEPIKEDLATAPRNFSLITCASSGDLDADGIAKSLTDKTIKYQFWDNSIFIESVGLSAGNKFRITASNLKDLSDNAMQTGTDANSATNFRKIESADLTYSQWEGTVFNPTYRDESPFVTYSFPAPGSNSAPLNLARIEIGFSEGVQTSTLTSTTFKVYPLNSLGVEGTALTATSITYDDATKTAYFNLNPAGGTANVDKVAAGTQYKIKLTTGVQDSGGNAMKSFNPWDANCTTAYENMFTVASSNDTIAPKVMGTSLEMYRNCAASTACPVQSVPTGIGAIDIKFSEAMDVNTIKDLNAGDATSNIYVKLDSNDSKVAGSVEYNSFDQKATFIASAALTNNVAYTLVVGTGVKDIAANAIASQYTLGFATSSSADTSKPFVGQAEAEAFEARIFFNERIVKTQVEDINNYALESPIGTAISLRGKSAIYDPMGNMVKIPNLALTGDKNFRVTVSGVTDIAGNAISTTADHHSNDDHAAAGTEFDPNSPRDIGHEATPNMDNTQFNQFEGYVMAHFGGFFGDTAKSDYTHEQKMFDNFSGKANVFPQMGMAGQTSVYFINFPVRTAIPLGGSIVIRFPEGYDVTNAQAMAAFNPASPSPDQSPMNGDINGPNTGTITIASVTPNVIARTVTVVTAGAASQANDFISLDIKGIVNPNTPKDFGSQGYTATITTKSAAGLTLEGPTDSQPIFITSKGTGTVSGTITAAGADDSETFTVRLQTPNGMIQEVLVINDDKVNGASGAASAEAAGEAKYSFVNLPAGDYNIFVDPVVTLAKSSANTDYMAPPFGEMIRLADGGTKTYNMALTDSDAAEYTDNWGNTLAMRTLTVNITGGPASKKVMVHAGGPMNFFEKEVTLNGSGAGAATIKVPEGMYWINVDPYMPMMATTMGPPPAPDFCPPPGTSVNINNAQDGSETAADAITVALANYTANKYIEVTVQDTNDVAINNVDVSAHNPNKGFGVPPARTGQNGKATIKVPAGTYQIDAFVPGMPPLPPKTVTVSSSNDAAHPASVTIEISFDSDNMIEVTGQVVNGSSTVPYAPVWATEINSTGTQYLPGFVPGGTDSNGKFSFFVPSGSNWELRSNIPGMGETSAIKLYNITSSPSSQTLSARTDLVAITGTIKLNNTAVQHANVFAEGTGATAFFNGTDTATDGTYTLYVQAGNYRIKTFSPEYGEKIVSAALDVSDGEAEALGITDLSNGAALVFVTVNFKDAAGSAMTVEKAFVDIFSSSTGEGNKKDFSGVSSGTLKIPAGTYSVNGFIKGVGPIAPQTLNTASTQIVNIQASASTVTISGTVSDGTNNIEGAFIDIFCSTTGFKDATRTLANGTYSITVPANQTYEVIAHKFSEDAKYQPVPPVQVTVAASNSSGNNFTLTAADENKKITGSVYLGTAIAANLSNNTTKKAFVWAETQNGDWVGAPVEANGSYTLYVKAGTWKVRAAADGYETAMADVKTITIANTASTGQNFALTAISGYTTQQAAGTSFTPTSSGRASSPDNKARVVAPAQSIKSDADSGDVTMQIKPTTRAPKKTDTVEAANDGTVSVTPTITAITTEAQEVTAEDTSGPIATLAGNINIEFDYSSYDAAVITAIEANPELLTCQYLNEANQWETTEAASNDTTNHILTCTTSHLSVYAPSVPSNLLAPAVPSGVSASAGDGSATITWTKNSESDMHHYIVWESELTEAEVATVLQSACSGSTCSYTHSGRTNGTTYGYQIMSVDGDGYTSAGSSVKTATPQGSGGGGSGSIYIAPQPEAVEEEEVSAEAPNTVDGNVVVSPETGGQTTLTTSDNTTIKAVIPAGAVAANTTITVTEKAAAELASVAPAPEGKSIIGKAYNMQAVQGSTNITTFEKHISLTFTYTNAQIFGLSESSLKVYYWNNTQWIALPTTVNTTSNTIIATVDHFTYFAIMGTPEITADSNTASLAYSNGSLLKVKGNPTIWLIEDALKHGIPSAGIFESRFRWQDIIEILSSSTLEQYETGDSLKYPDGTLIMGSDKTVYAVSDNGKKRGFTSAQIFLGLGYKWENIVAVADAEIARYATGTLISSTTTHPTGSLINNNGTIFQIDSTNKLRGIPTPNVFATNRLDWGNVVTATAADKALTIGPNLSFPDGTIVKEKGKLTVYVIADQKKRGFTSAAAFTSRGYKWDNIIEATEIEVTTLTDGEVLE